MNSAELETMDYLEFIARTTSHIPGNGQVTIRCFDLYAHAYRGKVKKARRVPVVLGMIKEEPKIQAISLLTSTRHSALSDSNKFFYIYLFLASYYLLYLT